MINKLKYFLNLFYLLFIFIQIKCQNQTEQLLNNSTINPQTINSTNLPLKLKIGLLFANSTTSYRLLYGFAQSAPAINLALKRAKNESLIDNVDFTFTWLNCDCDQSLAAGYTNRLFLDEHVDAIIGPPCVTASLVAGYAAAFYNFPMFLWGATVAADLSDQNIYPTVTNINTNTKMLALAVQSVIWEFQWKEISLIYIQDDARRACNYFQRDFEDIINNNPNITIVFKMEISPTMESIKEGIKELKNRSRIILTCFDYNVDRRNFLLAATDMGLVENNDFVFIIPQLRNQGMLQMISTGHNGSKYDSFWKDTNSTNDGRDSDALKASRRSIIIDLENRSNTQIDAFVRNMYTEFGQPPFNCNDTCMGGPEEQIPSSFSRGLHDATYAYLRALNKTTEKFGYLTKEMARNGTLITNMSHGEFQGETGDVIFDEQGNRQPTFFVTMLDSSDQPQVVIDINIVSNNTILKKLYSDESTIWVNNNGKRPLYKPICGYTGTDCPQDMTTYIIIGIGLVLLIVICFTLGIGYAVRERNKEKKRLTKECIIPFIELRNLKEIKNNDGSNIEINKSLRSIQSNSNLSTNTKTTANIENKKLETENYSHFLYNREVVFGVKYQVRVRIFNEDLTLLRKIRQLDHDNLNKFYGVCTDAPILYAIWKHCQRGSLKDLIAKEQYVGDSFVMFTLMRDIASGLIALHQSFIGAHGMLSSENCLINDRWQVKISDFGLNMIRESQPITKKKLLWTAPELLRENNRKGTKEGDVYSFAIICCELVNRETVWNGVEREDDVDDILHRLKQTNSSIPPRPLLHNIENQNLIHLIRDCWNEKTIERPKMIQVRSMLKQMVNDGNQNLMDYVFGMLEQYASSLEQEVEERTRELVEEKRKSDILLYRMLPKQVAEKLKLGEFVEPEQFSAATVFFSDVVSFTIIASKCTPLQVVNLLNMLYTTFDGIIDSHDVYKVETIGDGYLVCSGIPKRNGNDHAKEIAELSFAFLRTVSTFRIHHLPNERVNLRIGIHTGPAVAGVVGLTMPRYCLFGDTVNTASRMESNGRPSKIHISSETNKYLTNVIGGYLTEPRGEIIIKGKGVMETFWLIGHNNDLYNNSWNGLDTINEDLLNNEE
uniref:Guanylate cyclase n=1 Tax=Meloidogyne hapla TaxID=6305 RepID=A0A1I8B604_MELHA